MPAVSAKRKTTARDFFRLPEGTRAQLINGELVMSPAPQTDHQRAIGKVHYLIQSYLSGHHCGEIFLSSIDVKFSDNEVYQPDIVYVAKENLDIVKNWGIDGVPDLIIEVLSASTAYYDLTHKRHVYENFGVKDYLIIDPIERTAELFLLQPDGKFLSQGLLRGTGKISLSTLPSLSMRVEEIFSSGLKAR